MKKLLFLLSLVLVSNIAYAGTITVTYDNADEARIQEGITNNSALCNEGESLSDCTNRVVREDCQNKIRNYEQDKDAKTAREAVTNVSLT